jgi:hypothetical protein
VEKQPCLDRIDEVSVFGVLHAIDFDDVRLHSRHITYGTLPELREVSSPIRQILVNIWNYRVGLYRCYCTPAVLCRLLRWKEDLTWIILASRDRFAVTFSFQKVCFWSAAAKMVRFFQFLESANKPQDV